jgi:hypothetical protein
MASAVSLEYLLALAGQPDGFATLDSAGKIPESQIPAGSIETYKGIYGTSALLIAAHTAGSIADYAWVIATNSFWYWNCGIVVPGWVNQVITPAAYNALSANAKAAVPYIILP